MRKLLPILAIVLLASCSKDSLNAPKNNSQAENKTSSLASYKDANITIKDFEANVVNDSVALNFTTVFANNVQTVEILRGLTSYTLCSIYKQDVSNTNIQNLTFATTDSEPAAGQTYYYMVKYTLASGDWAYTPVIELQSAQPDSGSN